MKQILSSDVLPQHMQDELASLQKTLEGKYGAAACIVGTAMENMSTVVNIIRHSATMTTAERDAAFERARDVCGDVLRTLGTVLRVEPDSAVAVANAYRDYGARVEEELLGGEVLSRTESDALAVIAKAKLH
jgi:hypothetical protein